MESAINHQLASFILDIPILLPALGFLAGRLAKSKISGLLLYCIALLGFWLIAGGLYFDALSMRFLLGGIGRGNHFMWNSGIEALGFSPWIEFLEPTYRNFWSLPNILALSLFLFVYPAVLWLGFKKGRQ